MRSESRQKRRKEARIIDRVSKRTFLTRPIPAKSPEYEAKQLERSYDEFELIGSICIDSFYEFVREFWSEVIAEEPVWNWHIKLFCSELQEMAERVFKNLPKKYDLVVNVPPGTTKSTVFSILFPAWVWTRMPSARFICGSHALNLAQDLARKSRIVIKSEKYQKCFPHVVMSEEQDTKTYFATTKGGQRFSIGSTGNVIGMHAHFVIIDDPIDPKGSISEILMKEVNRWIDETLSRRKVSIAVCPMILVMQRLHEDDPSGAKLAKAKRGKIKVKHICLPAEKSDLVSPKYLKDMYNRQGLLDPIRLSRQALEEAKEELGPFGYAGQYDQNPVPRGGGMFQVERILIQPPPMRFKRVIRFWDKAVTSGGGAWTVGAKLAQDFQKNFWILDIRRGQWDTGLRERRIRQAAEEDTWETEVGLEEEPGSGGKESTQETIKELAGFRVRVVRPRGDKIARADSFSIQVNNGNVRMVPGEWNKVLQDELRHFPFSKYKDQVDALTGGFSVLIKPTITAGAIR